LLRTPQQKLPMLFIGPDSPQNCHVAWGTCTPSNTWFLVPSRVSGSNGISICSAGFTGLTNVTHKQTHIHNTYHATPSVAIDRIWLLLRCSLKYIAGLCSIKPIV